MENIELIFKNIQIDNLEKILFEELKMLIAHVKESHFYDSLQEKDLKLQDVPSLKKYFSHSGTGNILLQELDIGVKVSNVIIVISFDEIYGDLVVNFPCNELIIDKKEAVNKYNLILNKALSIYKKLNLKKVIFGYEPAEDDDMIVFRIDKTGAYQSYNN